MSTPFLVIGSNGAFGAAFTRWLAGLGPVDAMDLQDAAARPDLVGRYVSCDATLLDEPGRELVASADVVIVCLPEQEALQAVPRIMDAMPRGALIVDILSTKTPIVRVYEESPRKKELEILSIHPMFAPSVEPRGQNVIAVEVNAGARARQFVETVRAWEANITQMSADEHDRMTALTQAVTHASILAFGSALAAGGYDISKALDASTPVHRTLLTLLGRMASADPNLYFRIQTSNPHAGPARALLARALSDLVEALERDDFPSFERRFRDVRAMFGDRPGEIEGCSKAPGIE
jgi:prephenate dehydrogenase